MPILQSTYKTFDVKQQKNTFYYYNYKICLFLKNFEWFTKISDDVYMQIKNKIKNISTSKTKDHIEPYYLIYKEYLTTYKNIFKKNATYIDCGCAPGGFLKFANDMGMLGYGLTLEPSNENKGLDLKYDVDVIYGNLLKESFLESLDKKIKNKVDFVNMGAVLYDKENEISDHAKLFINQFYVAKQFLKKGGSIMFVLDIFYTLFNLLLLGNFFISLNCKVNFIPVQPSFQTTQVYVLIENLPELTDDIFQKLTIIREQGFFPVFNGYDKIIKNLFTSPLINIESFTEAYLINFLSKKNIVYDKKTDTIYYELLPTMMLDMLTKSNYNLRYISYPDFMSSSLDFKNSEYEIMLEKALKKRNKFIELNKLPINNGQIKLNEIKPDVEIFKNTNKFVKNINSIFIKYIF